MTAAGAAPLFEQLLVLDDKIPQPAALNMAIDEALLLALGPTPLLRIYRWERQAVSMGFFEPWAATSARFPGRELVRRWTGGGIVEHGEDFTYSLLLPRTHPLTNLPAGESYRLIHLAIQRCLEQLGEGEVKLNEEDTVLDATLIRECFTQPVRHDLLLSGRKLAGAAQRRTRQGLLHQGSLHPSGATDGFYEEFGQRLPGGLAARQTGIRMRKTDLRRAEQLVAEKYGTVAWTRRR